MNEPLSTSVMGESQDLNSPTSMGACSIPIGTPQKEDLAPSSADISMTEPPRFSVQVEKETEQELSSKELSAHQIFQALVRRGCQDLTRLIDTDGYSLGVVAGGNFGDIWKGKLNDGTDVAIKVWRLSSLAGDNHKALKRLTREIYNWSKAKHANIHQLLGVIMFQGRVGMVSKWMPNGNLQEYLLENKTADKYQLCAQVSKGVQYLHANNMIHGDLKATNILVSSDGIAMLTDFDHSIISNCSLVFSVTTQNGGGTLRWMARELLVDDNSRRNKETDMYALGMTLLEIITGTIPYPQCRNDAQVINKVTKKILPERNTTHFTKDHTGDRIWGFLKKCWDHRPTSRPTAIQAAELFRALCPKPTALQTPGINSSSQVIVPKASTLSRFGPLTLLPPIPEAIEQSPPKRPIVPIWSRTTDTVPRHSLPIHLPKAGSPQAKPLNRRTSHLSTDRQRVKDGCLTLPTRREKATLSKFTASTQSPLRGPTNLSSVSTPTKKQPCATRPTNATGGVILKSPSSSPVASPKYPLRPPLTPKTTPTKHSATAALIPSSRSATQPVQTQRVLSTRSGLDSLNIRAKSVRAPTTPNQGNPITRPRLTLAKRRGAVIPNEAVNEITSTPSLTPSSTPTPTPTSSQPQTPSDMARGISLEAL